MTSAPRRRTALALVLAALLYACAPAAVSAPAASAQPAKPDASTPVRGGTWVAVIGADPDSLNVNTNTGGDVARAVWGVYSGLVQFNEKLEPIPDAAESWTVSPDGKRYEFKLRKGIKFHDGSPLTSEDVRYTVEEVSSKYNGQAAAIQSVIQSIETPDPLTVVFNLKGPSAVFIQGVGVGFLGILPKKIFAGTDPRTNPANKAPIGSGPFKFKEWVKGDHITLVRNEDYYKPGQPYLDQWVAKIIPDGGSRVIAFQKGDIDFIDGLNLPREAVPDLKKIPGVQVNEKAGQPGNELLQININRKPFDDIRVRQAIAYAIDQQAVIDKAYFGVGAAPSQSHIMATLPAFYDPSVKIPHHDVAKANELLDQAGLKKGPDGTRFKAEITVVPNVEVDRRSAEVVRDNLRDAGIAVTLRPLDTATILKEVYTDANFDMVVQQLTSKGDPSIGIERWYTTSGIKVSNANASRYSNPELDQAFKDGATTTDPAGRKAAYAKVQQILARDLPAYPILDYIQVDFARPDTGGVFQSPFFYYRMDVLFKRK